MRRLNKKGLWMAEESGKFILGVIAVVLLLLLAFKLGGILRQQSQYEQAKYTIGEIEKMIESIKDGETKTLFIESPKGWHLVAFQKSQELTDNPTTCGRENCLCLCPKANKESCQTKGICKKNILPFQITTSCSIKGVRTPGCYQFSIVPLLLSILKKNERILFDPGYSTTHRTLLRSTLDEKTKYNFFIIENKEKIPLEVFVSDGKALKLYMSGKPEDSKTTTYTHIHIPLINQDVKRQEESLSKKGYTLFDKQEAIGNILLGIQIEGKTIDKKINLPIVILIGDQAFENVGDIDKEGNVWLSKSFLEDFFSFDERIIWSEEKRKIESHGFTITRKGGLFGRNFITLEIKKTNIKMDIEG